jgi:hypothetical protein
MAWDSKSARRRQNSNAATRPIQTQNRAAAVTTTFEPKSAHVADPALQPFLNPSFDPADYLNAALPSLQASHVSLSRRKAVCPWPNSRPRRKLSSRTSAHTPLELTGTLTQLTDEILRSGSRLAYEVEVLRGETLGLSEALTEGLQDDVAKFVPGGLDQDLAREGNRE